MRGERECVREGVPDTCLPACRGEDTKTQPAMLHSEKM